MNSLVKILSLCSVLVLSACHIDGSSTKHHDEDGNRLSIEGKPCIWPGGVNIYAPRVDEPGRSILLKKLGFDPIIDFMNVHLDNNNRINVVMYVTGPGRCLLLVSEVSRNELSHLLGLKTFGGLK